MRRPCKIPTNHTVKDNPNADEENEEGFARFMEDYDQVDM